MDGLATIRELSVAIRLCPSVSAHGFANGVFGSAQGCHGGHGPVDGLLRKVLVVDEFPYVLGDLFVFFDHHPMVVIGIELNTKITHPLVQAAKMSDQYRGILHPPEHERWHFDNCRLRSLGDLLRRPGMSNRRSRMTVVEWRIAVIGPVIIQAGSG